MGVALKKPYFMGSCKRLSGGASGPVRSTAVRRIATDGRTTGTAAGGGGERESGHGMASSASPIQVCATVVYTCSRAGLGGMLCWWCGDR